MTERNPPVIRASEIGEYIYCARSWWLHQVKGIAPRNTRALDQGQRVHDQHGRAVASYRRQLVLALLLLGLALLSGLAAAILFLGGTG